MGTRTTDNGKKTTFYSWKQVMRMPHTLNEPVITRSPEWFQDKEECVKDAKRKFKDEYKATKRVIIKKMKTLPLNADEVDMATKLKQAEDLLTMSYSLEVSKMISQLACEMCIPCLFNEEGDPIFLGDHSCRMSEQEQVDKYFNAALEDMDNELVIGKWMKLVIDDPHLCTMPAFNLVPYQCKDYRDNTFKSPEWVNGLKQCVVKMLKLQKRL
ncbi:uncharacterized protein [Haliotis cracherodii]|uniref:uncharacterized protein LOC124128474 n=1 Tax=Haliotis rufescens TaxID=6454 RepID=UPI001EB0607F|nr:uncharacterized protein LOC124128474 [Haliotis rufescens]